MLGVVIAVSACTDALPCTNCPPVDGTYAVSWPDAGTPDPVCPVPRVATVTLAQRNAQVTSELEGVVIAGTYYDSYDLIMSGTQDRVTYRLRALVIPTGTSVDGGIELRGNLTARTFPEMGDPCESAETFTAQRTSR